MSTPFRSSSRAWAQRTPSTPGQSCAPVTAGTRKRRTPRRNSTTFSSRILWARSSTLAKTGCRQRRATRSSRRFPTTMMPRSSISSAMTWPSRPVRSCARRRIRSNSSSRPKDRFHFRSQRRQSDVSRSRTRQGRFRPRRSGLEIIVHVHEQLYQLPDALERIEHHRSAQHRHLRVQRVHVGVRARRRLGR